MEGTHFIITGLSSAVGVKLNGLCCHAESFDEDSSRYTVTVTDGLEDSVKKIRASNLVRNDAHKDSTVPRHLVMASSTALTTGVRVEIAGLRARPELNGRILEIIRPSMRDGAPRCAVDANPPILIKPANLRAVVADRSCVLVDPKAPSLLERFKGEDDVARSVAVLVGTAGWLSLSATNSAVAACLPPLDLLVEHLNAAQTLRLLEHVCEPLPAELQRGSTEPHAGTPAAKVEDDGYVARHLHAGLSRPAGKFEAIALRCVRRVQDISARSGSAADHRAIAFDGRAALRKLVLATSLPPSDGAASRQRSFCCEQLDAALARCIKELLRDRRGALGESWPILAAAPTGWT